MKNRPRWGGFLYFGGGIRFMAVYAQLRLYYIQLRARYAQLRLYYFQLFAVNVQLCARNIQLSMSYAQTFHIHDTTKREKPESFSLI